MKHLVLLALIMGSIAMAGAAERTKYLYKIVRLSDSVVGVSCPGNNGDPTVITNIQGTLLVSCGTGR